MFFLLGKFFFRQQSFVPKFSKLSDFFKYILGSFGKICEEQDEKKRIFEGKYIDYETYVSECLADDKDFSTQRTRFGTGLLPGKEPLKISQN